MIIYLKNCWVEQKNHSFLANWSDWALSSHYLLWLEGSLSVHLALSSTAPFGRPSASLDFLHSLTPPHYACRISLRMLVLSHSNTLYLNGHTAGCGCHEILIPRSFNILFFSRFCHFRLTSSPVLAQPLFCKLKNSSTKWPSLWKIEVNNPSFYEKRLDLAVTSSQLLRLFAGFPIHHFISAYLSVQDTTPEDVLSSCGCSLTPTITTSIVIWHSAGSTKGETSPAAHRGIWQGAGATKSWLHSGTLKKSFALIKKVSRQPKYSIWVIRETLRDDNRMRIRVKKILMSERVSCGYPWMLVHWICLRFSLFLFARTLTLVVVDSSSFKIEEFLDKMAISLKNCRVEQNNHSFVPNWSDRGLSSQHLMTVEADLSVHPCIPVLLPPFLISKSRKIRSRCFSLVETSWNAFCGVFR